MSQKLSQNYFEMGEGGLLPPAGVATASHPASAREIEPGSLLWTYAGDRRMAFTGLSAGILQLLHPAIGAGVVDHSDFFNDPWDRIIRSIPQIMGVVYRLDAETLGHRVRDRHARIEGVDQRGRPYRALDPETFWWAHATFQHAVEQVVDRFDDHRLSPLEREELYRDGIEWYRRYGVSMSPVPATYGEFRAKWQDQLESALELTPAAERTIDMALHTRAKKLPFLPAWTRPFQPRVVNPVLRLAAIGGLPPVVRHRFAIPWRADEELEYRILQLAVRKVWRRMPATRRYGPVARAGFQARHERRSPQADPGQTGQGAAESS
ncbi:MAG: DUF2236 domain-containing protein [Acidimicrobiales bacterium]|nr:DUF2236 domain-containing protein [Acidimicrobiales bacterium]